MRVGHERPSDIKAGVWVYEYGRGDVVYLNIGHDDHMMGRRGEEGGVCRGLEKSNLGLECSRVDGGMEIYTYIKIQDTVHTYSMDIQTSTQRQQSKPNERRYHPFHAPYSSMTSARIQLNLT